MGKDFGVTFLGLWWAEFHAEKEMGAKMVGLPGSAVPHIHIAGWWFGTFFIFPYVGNSHPN